MKKKLYATVVTVLLLVTVIGMTVLNRNDVQAGYGLTQAQNRELIEMLDNGVDAKIALDEIIEKYNIKGLPYSGTGGLDSVVSDWAAKTYNVKGVSPTETTKPTKPTCSHEWVAEESKLATCTTEGEITQTCTKCGKQKKEKTPVVDHDYVLTEETKGDCLTKATYTYTCTKCGDVNIQTGELGEHSYIETENSKWQTCYEEGYKEMKCTICGDIQGEVIPAYEHLYTEEKVYTVTPTCTTGGKQAYKCQHCGDLKDEEDVEPLGHKAITPIIKELPTFFKDGENVVKCATCKEIIETIKVPATGGIWRFIIPVGIVVLLIGYVVYRKLIKKKK